MRDRGMPIGPAGEKSYGNATGKASGPQALASKCGSRVRLRLRVWFYIWGLQVGAGCRKTGKKSTNQISKQAQEAQNPRATDNLNLSPESPIPLN